MFKSLIVGAALSLASLGAFALPDPVDVSGIELGSNIEDALAEFKERYPDAKPSIKKYINGRGISSVEISANSNRWTLRTLKDGSGRIASIYRKQFLHKDNVSTSATLEALREKYGQEGYHESGRWSENYYWAAETADAPEDFEIESVKNLHDYSGYLGPRNKPNPEFWENVRSIMAVSIEPREESDKLVGELTISATAVDDIVTAYVKEVEAERRQAEEKRQQALKEAKGNAADI